MRASFLRVGATLLGTVLLLLAAVLLLAGDPFAHGTPYETYFDESVQGLGEGAAVRYRGVALGHVTAIALAGAAYGRAVTDDATARLVVVRFVLDDARSAGLPDPVRAVSQGLRVRMATPGLTGPEYLELDFADPARFPPDRVPWTPRDPYVPAVPSTLSVVRTGAEHLLGQLDHVDIAGLANGLGALVAILREELGPAGGMRGTLAQANDTLRLADEQLRAADLPALAAGLRRTAADADALLRGRELHGLLASAAGAADRLSAVAARLPPLLATLQTVAGRADSGTAALEAQLAPMLADARAALRNLREASQAAREDPAGLLLGAPPPRVLPR